MTYVVPCGAVGKDLEADISVIWVISDGKPGHLNQSLGLAEAICRRKASCRIELKQALGRGAALRAACSSVPDKPDLIIAAGHRTHWTLLAMKRATGAPAVVLMKPSLPIGWFDYCLIPAHDRPPARDNIAQTQGAINRMRSESKQRHGMILIGGPSEHFEWDSVAVIKQLGNILSHDGEWLLTTSRRTPDDFLHKLQSLGCTSLEVVPFEQTDKDWLGKYLPQSQFCWVSPDSVSMVYEALTAGCAVATFELPSIGESRVVAGLNALREQGKVRSYSDWKQGVALAPVPGFNEAERCADLIVGRFLQ